MRRNAWHETELICGNVKRYMRLRIARSLRTGAPLRRNAFMLARVRRLQPHDVGWDVEHYRYLHACATALNGLFSERARKSVPTPDCAPRWLADPAGTAAGQ